MERAEASRFDLTRPVERRRGLGVWRGLTHRVAWRQAPTAARLFIPEA